MQPKVLTFDVYGTLIDWETGLNDALQQVFRAHGVERTESEALQLFAHHEAQVGAGDYLPYRDVLAETLVRIGRDLNFKPVDAELRAFVESVRDWPAFEDSHDALLRLQKHFKLAVITNCDDEHFAMSNRQLRVEFDYIVTAELARSYKPSLNNFRLALGSIGVSRNKVLHVAESLFHDHVPAKKLGLATVWINRRHNKVGQGATPSAVAAPDAEYPSMSAFADAILGEGG
ncbi:haloacid dehalogenase type II [Achromobacter seleniivolatilans]|uniref:Haloacid dehalogenase type II n=1 Tax=Achromobacter seleniivolatilans TaxID=3047478 RepID=A0ABY9M8M4_9BURK|nr:haloacid dehalogenase type II [Achromobacter sp. R39]WMD22142.1 haloacid dehalogenase type II [Achromobacter sp. R39]